MLFKLLAAALLPAVLGASYAVTATHRDFPGDWPDGCNDNTVGGLQGTIAGQAYPNGEAGMVNANLVNGKPTCKTDSVDPAACSGNLLTTAANFNQWYQTTPTVNYEFKETILLQQVGTTASGIKLGFESSNFWPINGRGFNDGNKEGNNGFFTTEIDFGEITYFGGETFDFEGDDDVFVFINNKLVLDLGGMHVKMSATVNLDSLGLTIGNKYPLKFFHAERCCCGSNFKVSTSITLVGDPPSPPPFPPPSPPRPPPMACAKWCNRFTCEKAECRECPPPTCGVATKDLCYGYCTAYTCEKKECTGCSLCAPPDVPACSIWCNKFVCPDKKNKKSSFLYSHCGGCSYC